MVFIFSQKGKILLYHSVGDIQLEREEGKISVTRLKTATKRERANESLRGRELPSIESFLSSQPRFSPFFPCLKLSLQAHRLEILIRGEKLACTLTNKF